MGIKDEYFIQEIPNEIATYVVERYHYLHRKPPISFSFGIFRKKPYEKSIVEINREFVHLLHNGQKNLKRLAGIITYGTPCSAPLRSGICGEDEKNNIIELNRLWTRNKTPKNLESFFVMNTVDKVDKEIVISYADTKQGHIGTIYQACNWYYIGTNSEIYDLKVKDLDIHGQSLYDKYTAEEIKEKFKDKCYKKRRSKKHRYVYFNCNSRREEKLKNKLNYEIKKEYPKEIDEERINKDNSKIEFPQKQSIKTLGDF